MTGTPVECQASGSSPSLGDWSASAGPPARPAFNNGSNLGMIATALRYPALLLQCGGGSPGRRPVEKIFEPQANLRRCEVMESANYGRAPSRSDGRWPAR